VPMAATTTTGATDASSTTVRTIRVLDIGQMIDTGGAELSGAKVVLTNS